MNESRDRGVDDILIAAVDGLIMAHPTIRPSAIKVAFQMGEVAIPRNLFTEILRLIAELHEAFGAAPSIKTHEWSVP
jgi:hypothetical protein